MSESISHIPIARIAERCGLIAPQLDPETNFGLANVSANPTAEIDCRISVDSRSCVVIDETATISPSTTIEVDGPGSILYIGRGCNFAGSKISIKGSNNICYFADEVKARGDRFAVSKSNCAIIVGRSTTTVGGGQILCEADGQTIIIGADCMFAHGVVIRTSDGHAIFDRETHQLLNPSASVVIHSHVWLANSVRVSKGSRIGQGTIVAQNSIVSGLLESNSLYAGSPARLKRQNVVWSRSNDYSGIPVDFR